MPRKRWSLHCLKTYHLTKEAWRDECIYFSKSELNLLYEFCGRLLWQWDEVKNQAAGDFSDSCWREQLIRWSHHLWNRNSDDNCEHWAAALLRGVASGGEELYLARGDVETILGPTDIAVRSPTCWTLAVGRNFKRTTAGDANWKCQEEYFVKRADKPARQRPTIEGNLSDSEAIRLSIIQFVERFGESDFPKMLFFKYQHSSPWQDLVCLMGVGILQY